MLLLLRCILLPLLLLSDPHPAASAETAGPPASTPPDSAVGAGESCDANAALQQGTDFAQSYTLSGCSNPSQCGVYRRVDARCLKDYTEGGLCGPDPTLCDQAPV
jgi:hypothetical protein|eukprot:COSAG03_NODE_1968_length_3280_cov_21.156869_5_plen_105_part_00